MLYPFERNQADKAVKRSYYIMEEKMYLSPMVDVILLGGYDVITMSTPVSGEDGNDIFDDR